MKLECESVLLEPYLNETEELDYSHPLIKEKAEELFRHITIDAEKVRAAFEFVRDEVAHSWDIQSRRITRTASEVLLAREGICYAKANLVAALLRSAGIPTGFCYQRLTVGDHPDTGYCIHALNAVCLREQARWIRIDARGNKPGVDAQFSLEHEQLAFPVRTLYDEIDYPIIYAKPNAKTMEVLRQHSDTLVMYQYHLPSVL